MKARGWVYIWFLPLFWCLISMASFHYPGDEYGLWAISSIAGTWIVSVIGNVGDIKDLLPKVLIAGGGVMLVIGFIMDRLRVNYLLPLVVVLVVAPALCLIAIAHYPSYQAAMSKSGSLIAYVLASINVGLYAAILVSIPATVVVRLVQRRKARGALKPPATTAPEAPNAE